MNQKTMGSMKSIRGSGLVEVVFGVVIISLVLLSLIGAYNSYLKNSFRLTEKMQAAFLLEEGLEALRVMRDTSWATSFGIFATSSTYYFAFDGTTWRATTSPVYVDGKFLRSLKVAAVNRDQNDDIINGAGTADSSTKKATVSVSWLLQGSTSTISQATYFTNLFNN